MIRVYVAQNMFSLNPDCIVADRKYADEKIIEYGLEPIYLFCRKDLNKPLPSEEIVNICYQALSRANAFLMLDGDKPGWGKLFEMSKAIELGIPRITICLRNDINPWIDHFSTEIFTNIESALSWIRFNVPNTDISRDERRSRRARGEFGSKSAEMR